MKKFKCIAQDDDGEIWKFEKKPKLRADGTYKADGHVKSLAYMLCVNVTPIRINLKKNGYEIKDGILLKVKIYSFPKVRGLTITTTPTRAHGPDDDPYNKKTCDLMMRAWRLIIRSETGER